MTDFKDMLESSDYRNWMKCSFAQLHVKALLAEIVEEDINDLQKQLLYNVQTYKGLPSNTICNCCLMPNLLSCRTAKMCKIKNKACSFHKEASLQPRRCPTNGLCDDIRIGIIDHHRFRGPSWKNTDASKWCTDSWTIAKCYMPPDGYLNAKSAEETDFNGVLSVIINCIDCQRRFSEDLNNPINVCTKARDTSRVVRHSSTLKISDDERDNIIETLVDLLNDSMFFRSNQRSVQCREKLTKLKANALSVSTTDITRALEDSIQSANQALEGINKHNSLEAETETTVSNLCNLADNLQSVCTSVTAELEKRSRPYEEVVYHQCSSNMNFQNSRRIRIGEVLMFAHSSPLYVLLFLLMVLICVFLPSFDGTFLVSFIYLFIYLSCVLLFLTAKSAYLRFFRSMQVRYEMELRQIEHSAKAVKTLRQKLLGIQSHGAAHFEW